MRDIHGGSKLLRQSLSVNKSRYEGFEKAFEAIGEKPSEKMIYTGVEGSLAFSKAVSALLKQEPRCIICGDDMICMKFLSELNSLGKSVPEDIRVVSF